MGGERDSRKRLVAVTLDERGEPTTDMARALRGMLLPVGGHKGIGIAMMVECLAGAMAALERTGAAKRTDEVAL